MRVKSVATFTFATRLTPLGKPLPNLITSSLLLHRHLVSFDATSGQCKLTILGLTFEDEGEYKCTAANSAGQAAVTMQIRCIQGESVKSNLHLNVC